MFMISSLKFAKLFFRSSGENVTLSVMDMMPFHTLVGIFELDANACNFFYNIIWHSTLKLFTCNLYIISAASTFGVCVVHFFLPIFHRFILECFRMKARRSKDNEMYATQNLNKLAKYSEQLEPSPLPMRYSAFSW